MNQEWDIIVVGGGITGAGIFRQSVHLGYKTLLVEQNDFAWGTSSRSSKLVHGGLRYLKQGKIDLVRDSVLERQALLAELPGLVNPLNFLIADYKGQSPNPWLLRAGLATYDTLAGKWDHQWLSRNDFIMAAPHLNREGLTGGGRFTDAQVDDARLVLRVLLEGEAEGGTLESYTKATSPRREGDRTHLTLENSRGRFEVSARVVFSATGAWADQFSEHRPHRLRPLRGSHITFPGWRLPLPCALSFSHPDDGRPTFLVPWEGASFCGTTDLDHNHSLDQEPRIEAEEVKYLLRGLAFAVPHLELQARDIIGTWAGVRPVLSSSKEVDPSKETRDHALWNENGVVTMTGGKLTTFRLMAGEAMEEAAMYLPAPSRRGLFTFAPPTLLEGPVPPHLAQRLSGRYGAMAQQVAECGDLSLIQGSWNVWAELVWACRAERVYHLSDLLLRRTRLGFVLPGGGREHMEPIGKICCKELGWEAHRWKSEMEDYIHLWESAYTVAEGALW